VHFGTVYCAVSHRRSVVIGAGTNAGANLELPTALSLLVWYVFAPQCISTLSIVKRETNSWKPALAMAAYMFALAYLASLATYQLARIFL